MRGLAQDRAGSRRRRYPADGVAEPADLRRAGRQGRARRSRDRGARARARKASAIRAGLVSCTGATGCRFAAAHTKEQAEEIAAWCEPRVTLDTPVNIHLTGCHHSCAQHYIGDIGLIAARVAVNEEGDTVDGYNILVGGGFGPDATLARDIYQDVKAEDAPRTVERILKGYLAHRDGDETFLAFSRRHEADALKADVRRGGGRMSQNIAPPIPVARPRDRAVLARAARLAERLLRRPGVARRRGRHRALARAERRADAGRARTSSATPTTARRRGTTRRCRSPSA